MLGDLTGRDIAVTFLPRSVRVGGVRYLVRPPTVMEAMSIRAILPTAFKGDGDDLDALYDVLSTWLPVSVMEGLLRLKPASFIGAVDSLINQGVEKSAQTETKLEEDDDEDRYKGEIFLIAIMDYCDIYHVDPWSMMVNTPWPFWLKMLKIIDTASARRAIRFLEAYAIPHIGKEAGKTIEELNARAMKFSPESPPADSEQIARDRKRLRSMLGARRKK